MNDLPVIADIDEPLQAVQQAVVVVVEILVVNHQCVELISGLKTADFTEELSGRFCGYPEYLRQEVGHRSL